MVKSFGLKDAGLYFCTPKKIASLLIWNKVDLVAQLVEHNTFNVGALGSSPSGITRLSDKIGSLFISPQLKYVCDHKPKACLLILKIRLLL
jgi:hypothetical protein